MRKSKISFLLEYGELESLEKVLYLEPYLEDIVKAARKEKGKYRVTFFKDDFQEALDALFFQAGWIRSEKEKQCLMNLYEKLRGYSVLAQGFRKSVSGRLS